MKETFAKVRMGNWLITAAGVAIGAGVWLAFGKKLPPQIPMLYTRPWGEDQLIRPGGLLILPILCAGLGIITGWWAGKVKSESPLAIMIMGTSMVAQVVIILAMLRIVLLVI